MKSLRVLLSIIDLEPALPYQWALLKTYAEQDTGLKAAVRWDDPIHYSVIQAKQALANPRRFERTYRFAETDVLGISCYLWNFESQLEIARLAKTANPSCLVVAGGPQVDLDDSEIFRKYPDIDLVVKKDGEIPFRKILRRLSEGTRSFIDIPGLLINSAGGVIDTGDAELISKFELSPWLENKSYLETYISRLRKTGSQVSIVFETNRGCPYSCTFCNWGSNTMTKIRTFELENVRREIEWFRGLKIDYFCLADANFGILSRDLEISRWLCGLNTRERAQRLTFFPAKNNPARVVEIVDSFHRAGLIQQFAVGVQTMGKDALAAIGRSNISPEKLKAMVASLREKNIPLDVQLIIGCPGETTSSWRETVLELLELGLDRFQLFYFMILPNTPAAEAGYREKWRIRTARRKDGLGWKACIAEVITASSSFTFEQRVEMETYFYATHGLHGSPAIREAICEFTGDRVAFRAFYADLYDRFFRNPKFPLAYREYLGIRDYVLGQLSGCADEFRFFVWEEMGEKRSGSPDQYLRNLYLAPRDSHVMELRSFLSRNTAAAGDL